MRQLEGAEWSQTLAALFDDHHQRLFRLAARLCYDTEDAHDLVQETFLRIARQPSRAPQRTSDVEAWLVTVLVNLCRDLQRRRSVRERNPLEHSTAYKPQAAPNPETTAIAGTTVRLALAELEPRRRAVVVLRDLEDRSVEDIARLLGIRPVTVRWHHAAALRQLRNSSLFDDPTKEPAV